MAVLRATSDCSWPFLACGTESPDTMQGRWRRIVYAGSLEVPGAIGLEWLVHREAEDLVFVTKSKVSTSHYSLDKHPDSETCTPLHVFM